MLQTTVEALNTFSEKFGPYRHKTMTAVQGDFNDGMEYSGLYFISRDYFNLYDGTPKNYLVLIAAHETAPRPLSNDRRHQLKFSGVYFALLTIALKTVAWRITGSVGLLSDAAESLVNLVAAVTAAGWNPNSCPGVVFSGRM